MGILQALFGSQVGQQGMQNGFTPVNQMPQTQQQQAPQTLGLVQNILSQRFNPQMQDVAQSVFMNGTGLGTNGGITTPEAQTVQRLAPVMDIAKTLGTLNQSQLEIAKLNEQMRHDQATELQNPFSQPITTSPTTAGGALPPSQTIPGAPRNIPTMMQNNQNIAPQSNNQSIPQVMAGNAPVNNPGNLRPAGATSGFRQFASAQDGAAAMTDDLTAKVTGQSPAMVARYGPNYQPTLRNVITTYAPPSENNTEDYIASVSKQTGINPDAPLSTSDIAKIQPAMANVEQGTTQSVAQDNAAYETDNKPKLQPLYRGNVPYKDGLPDGYQWAQDPQGKVVATQIAGVPQKGENGNILSTDPTTGQTTQSTPINPQARAKFESNIQKIAGLFDQLHKAGGSIEAGGNQINNKLSQLAGTNGIEVMGEKLLPGGQQIMQGTQTQAIRDEIQGLIKQTTPLYMQAMGITPGMERAASAQQMLQEALGGSVIKSRQANQYQLSNLSTQAGTGEYAAKFGTLQAAKDAISKGADPKAVQMRLKGAGIDPGGLE